MYYTKEQVADWAQQTFAYWQIKEDQHVLTLTLNRPDQRNAMNEVVVRELAYALAYAHYSSAVWAVVLAANGQVFCSGADMKMFMGIKDEQSGSTIPAENSNIILGDLFAALHKPCIAKVAKSVFAGGFLLIGGCTHVVAAEDALFGLPEVQRGIFPFQVLASLLKIMPARQALDWCMMGKTLSASDAQATGLVTQVVSAADLDSTVDALLAVLCKNSPAAIRMGLQAYQQLSTIPTQEQHAFLMKCLMEVVQTKDAQEGILAFKEKRPPVWTGE